MADDPIRLVGLIGWPVEHSASPAMHNAAFAALELPWRYTLWPTPPGGVEAVLKDLGAGRCQGANVTVPHKQAVIPYLDEIDDAARAIGAVNTIVVRQDRLIGHNTDGNGFLAALREAGLDPTGQRALVLGVGGGARATIHALARAGSGVTIYNRTAQRAYHLARNMKQAGLEVSVAGALTDLDLTSFSLLVNATPVGMWPQVNASPWPETLPLLSDWTVFDLVYNPADTHLLARARAVGASAIGGLGMLVHQGALAFEMWTGHAPPVDVMRAAAENALGH